MKLTKDQKKAIQLDKQHALISAGAGTGKTRTLVERAVELVARRNIPVSELLILTFTDKAAGEIKERLSKRFYEEGLFSARQDLESAFISTFHGFASRLLRNHPVEAGVDPEFRVLENEEAELLKEEALDETISSIFESKLDAFSLFQVYGENAIRESLLAIYHVAGQEGLSLSAYFDKWKTIRKGKIEEYQKNINVWALEFMESISDKVDVTQWKKWVEKETYNWADIESFKAWRASCGRSPKLKAWKDFINEQWLPFRLESFAEQSMDQLEEIAHLFDLSYTHKKQVQNCLDFDDLQVLGIQMLRETSPGAKIVANALQRQFRYVFVDEFQDTSHLQMELVEFLMPKAQIFLVGDYKQSIYAFRGAEPKLFLETEANFEKSEATVKIELADNFRSRAGVLNFANGFFEKLWEEDDLPFSKLNVAKPEDENDFKIKKPELLVIDSQDDSKTAEERLKEGRQIAKKMLALNKEGVPYAKMAVLFSAMTHSALYEYCLRCAGIPYVSVSGMSFYEQPEIRDLISLLECLQNPLSDVAMASLLRSPFVHVSDETLFWLAEKAKADDEKSPLYDGLLKFREIEEISNLEKGKLEEFLSRFHSWRLRKDAGRLSDLIDEAVKKTGYGVWALAQITGIRRYGHVRKFIQIARRQESRGRLSIHRFLALVRRLQFQEVRESDQQASGEEIQAVGLMTIHASKGLEFPYVFLADLGRKKTRQERSPVLALPYQGWSIKVKNSITGKNESVWTHLKITERLDQQNHEERKRLFYVAVTRAEEHLVLSGVYKPVKAKRENYADMSSWMEWVMTEKEAFDLVDLSDLKNPSDQKVVAPSCAAEKTVYQKWFDRIRASNFPEKKSRIESPQAGKMIKRIETIYQPEFSKVIDLPVSAYVLFLKDKERFWSSYGQGWSLPQEQYFDRGEQSPVERSEDAADFGTRMHQALEFLDWSHPERSLDPNNLKTLFSGFSEARYSEAENILASFFDTKLFKDMKESSQVCRELSFVLNARRGLIEGVIDVLFLNPDGSYTVLDYKTAEGDAEKSKKQGYDLQIKIYALAASKILKKRVSQAQIYFLKNHQTVSVELDAMDKIESEVNELQMKLLNFVKEKWTHV